MNVTDEMVTSFKVAFHELSQDCKVDGTYEDCVRAGLIAALTPTVEKVETPAQKNPAPSTHTVPVSSPSGGSCDGWRASYITYSKYPYSVEWISDAWCLRFHHGNGAQSTVSKHLDPFSAMRSAPAPQTREATL